MTRVSNRAPVAQRLAARSRRDGECLLYVEGSANKRGHVRIGYQGRKQYVHRVAYLVAKGPIPAGLHVLHSCDVPRCIEPAHLRVGTNADNIADKVRRGRAWQPKGSKSSNALLTEAKVEQILIALGQGATLKELGERFGVHLGTVWTIKAGKNWTHVRPDLPRTLVRPRRAAA